MLVRESLYEFERGIDPKAALGIGNDFNTLSAGAILEIKKYFGSSKSTGIIGGYSSSANKFLKNTYLLIIEITSDMNNKKSFSWIKFYRLEDAKLKKEILKSKGKKEVHSDTWYNYKKGFFSMLTKKRFDYRFEIIEKGF